MANPKNSKGNFLAPGVSTMAAGGRVPQRRPLRQVTIGESISEQAGRVLRGQDGPRFDRLRQRHMWSTYHFHGLTGGSIGATGLLAANDYQTFQVPSSQGGQGLPAGFTMSDLDTNFPGAGRVADDQNFIVHEVGITVESIRQDLAIASGASLREGPVHPVDVDAILSNGILVIKYLTDEVELGPFNEFCQAGGADFAVTTLLDASAGSANVAGPPAFVTGGMANDITVAHRHRQYSAATNSGNFAPGPNLRRKLSVPIFLESTKNFSFILRFARQVQLLTVDQGGTAGFRARVDWWATESYSERG